MAADPERIVEYLRSTAGRPLKAKELARGLGIAEVDYGEFKTLLQRLEDEGVLYRVQRQRYAAPEKINLVVGRLHTTRSGAGFLTSDGGGDDIYVSADGLDTALDGDRVVVRIERRRRGPRIEGRVVRVLERARETIVGVFHPAAPRGVRRGGSGFGYVVPEDTRLARDVFIAPGDEGAAADGDVVVVRITHWGREHLGPAGIVETVLGRPDEPGVDVLTVVHGHGIDIDFPEPVEAEARAIRERGILATDHSGRADLRDTLVFTIDPADAKDHDDALSITAAGDGAWEVGIHIADVSHYVAEGSAIDAEALRRGTSTYLVDRVIPMLPHDLSSDLCSLRPGEDRLAMSLLLRVDDTGRVLDERFVRSVIRSRHRLSYEDAQRVLDGGATPDDQTADALGRLCDISRALRAARQGRGSLDFDLPEARVVLDPEGVPTDIQRVERLEAHRIIEDFMLLANERVAHRAASEVLPFIYRVHERPDEARLEQLREFAATFGHRVGGRGAVRPRDLQAFLAALAGRPEEALLSTVTLRSMKQARYSAENLGHFGLAARHYTHFTSPIRRYPDLIVHRLLGRYFLAGEKPADGDEAVLAEVARLASERERVAVSAERESIAMKKVEFMERHVADEFDGTIASVRAYGFYVLLDAYFVEGLVHVSFLDDDYYVYVEERFSLVGERTRRTFRLGDRVRVQVAGVDREERQIDFQLVSHAPGHGARDASRGAGRPHRDRRAARRAKKETGDGDTPAKSKGGSKKKGTVARKKRTVSKKKGGTSRNGAGAGGKADGPTKDGGAGGGRRRSDDAGRAPGRGPRGGGLRGGGGRRKGPSRGGSRSGGGKRGRS